MKNLTRISALLLALAMLLGMSALAAGEDTPLLGTYEGAVYTNAYFDVSFDGTDWEYESQEDLMAENDLTEALEDDDAAREYITQLGKNGEVYCDMTAYSPDGSSMVIGYIEFMTAAERVTAPDEETYVDMILSSLLEDDSYSTVEKRYGTFLGGEHPYLRMTVGPENSGDDSVLIMDEYYLYIGKYMFTALIATYNGEEAIAGLTALWSSASGSAAAAASEPDGSAAQDISACSGTLDGTAYINEYFGIGFDPGADWIYAGTEELAQLAADSSTSLGNMMETESDQLITYYDMLASSPDGQQVVYIGLSPLSASSQLLFQSSRDNLASLMYTLSKDSFDSIQEEGVVITSEVNTINFLGEETGGLYFGMDMDLDSGGQMAFRQQEVFFLENNCLMTVYLMTYTDDPDAVAEMANMFYVLP